MPRGIGRAALVEPDTMTIQAIALAVLFSALLGLSTASILHDLTRPLGRKGGDRDNER
jgi:hypothetical protein